MYERVVLKLSGEALAGGSVSGGAFDDAVIGRIAREIKDAVRGGTEMALVVGGGNFWRGKNSKASMDRTKSDQIGMLGTVMNAIYLSDFFRGIGLEAVVMTPILIGSMTVMFSKDLALDYMKKGFVVINAAGLGHPYFSTDTVTALRAAELSADCVLYAKNIDGVYDKDPKKYNDARKYKTISYTKVIADNLQAADIAAMTISMEAGIPSFLFALDEPDSIISACRGPEAAAEVGTTVSVDAVSSF